MGRTLTRLLAAIRSGPPDRNDAPLPVALQLGMLFSTLIGGIWFVLLALAPFNASTYRIDGHVVTGRYFFTHAGPIVAAITVLLLAIAFGIRTGCLWVRETIMALWSFLLLLSIVVMWKDDAWDVPSLCVLSFSIAVASWYLYGKENVVRYYRSLRRSRSSREATAA